MYCFRPKMETIPEGDWFCYECSNKNSIDKVCVICGRKGKLINCDTCTRGEYLQGFWVSLQTLALELPNLTYLFISLLPQCSIRTAWIHR